MSASGITWSDVASYLPYLSNAGVAGLWLACWLKGWVVSGRELDKEADQSSEWKELYLAERDSHERTREALALAGKRGDAAVDAVQLVAGMMNAVRVQAGHGEIPEAAEAARALGEGNQPSEGSGRAVRPSGRGRRGKAK